MKKKKKDKMTITTKVAGFVTLVVLTAGLVYFISMVFGGNKRLPVLGEPGHVAGAFSFVNQDGEKITDKTVENKVTVVEYFFTSCPSICPIMNKNLKQVYSKFKTNADFMILSHTVDPDRDSSAVLKTYSGKFGAVAPGWEFLTGNKDSLYQAARRDYLLAVEDSFRSAFIHTQYVALLDKKRQVRGFYDMSAEQNIAKLNRDIEELLKQ